MIGLKDHDKQPSALLKKYKTTDIESRGNGEFTVHLAEDVDPLQVAQELAGQPQFAYAEPDFVRHRLRFGPQAFFRRQRAHR
ncbi:hypothetical protein ACHMW6_23015 [Pseudoduganella sp. UC29_106]|uniref:hypothetical protein n=1 Tax=Pseudoduganella sp. UC29_106 TaxID=3374553 RepID=UPI0037579219